MVGSVRGILLVLLGAVKRFVLLIACANVTQTFLLARATGRSREFAIRSALGASPGRVIRQLLTESVMLGIAGGGIGLLLAKWGTGAILAALPESLPRTEEIGIDGHVMFFTLGISVLTGIVFGLVPALKTMKPDMHETLKEGGRGSSGARHRTQSVFVAVEMAMAVVLLIGAGLMIRSLAALWSIDPGFDPRNALAFSVSSTPGPSTTPGQLRSKYRETIRGLESVPGVDGVSLVGGALPMSGDSEVPFWVEGRPKPATEQEMPFALFYLVTPRYHQVMRIPVQRGRGFTERDDEHAPVVVLIDAAFARTHFREGRSNRKTDQPGIAGRAGGNRRRGGTRGALGFGLERTRESAGRDLSPGVAGSGQVLDAAGQRRRLCCADGGTPLGVVSGHSRSGGRVDSSAVVYGVKPVQEIVARSIATQQLAMMLLSVFSLLALVLSAIGIYGVISYLAGQRTHEIGVRMALGATSADVLRLVLGEGMRLTLIGVGIGIVGALGLTRLITKMIYGVGATDPITFAGVAILLTGVALLACYIPARRAMRVDPIIALRYE